MLGSFLLQLNVRTGVGCSSLHNTLCVVFAVPECCSVCVLQVDPLDIMRDVVDQAQLVYFKDFDKVVRREVHAQNALKQRGLLC